ncbi:hypothetical protein B0H10DRAFT_439649 [Mycena sp. CBHHK59/15]|nr:hypothetical protein B0H10DRAFT_439649 [Mycena sp. CBHHK59/15]
MRTRTRVVLDQARARDASQLPTQSLTHSLGRLLPGAFSESHRAARTPASALFDRARRIPPRAADLLRQPTRALPRLTCTAPLRPHANPITPGLRPAPNVPAPARRRLCTHVGRLGALRARTTFRSESYTTAAGAICTETTPAPPSRDLNVPWCTEECLGVACARTTSRSDSRMTPLASSSYTFRSSAPCAIAPAARVGRCLRAAACLRAGMLFEPSGGDPPGRVVSKLPRARARRELAGLNVSDLKGIQNSRTWLQTVRPTLPAPASI